MALRFRMVLAVVAMMTTTGISAFASPLPFQNREQKLQARIERQQNPVKRAKIKVRLGRAQLFRAIDSYDGGNFEKCRQLLEVYLETMKSAWADLQASGRQAWRRPNGFKQLDIGLREDGRFLEDLAHRVPFEKRGAVEKVREEAEELRAAVLKALFPRKRAEEAGSDFVGSAGRKFLTGGVRE